MKRFILPCATLLVTTLTWSACADNHTASTPEGENNKQWELGAEPDSGSSTPGDMSISPRDASPDDASMTPRPIDAGNREDLGTITPIDFGEPDFGQPDVGAPDFGEPDFGEPDLSEPDFGDPDLGGMEGEGCGNSNECADGLVCCASLNGQYSCTAENQCFTGGICEVNQDCPGMQECCDLSQFGVQQNVCRDRCRGMGGGGGGGGGMTGCTNNSECNGADEVCCPSFQGAAMCTPSTQCQTGGSCAVDADCLNGQTCCDFFGQAAICFDQCPF